MAISNPNPQARDIVIYQRDDANTYWGEVHISGSNRIIYVDSSGHINADDSGSFYTLFPPSGSSGGSGTTLATGSLVPITSSWAINAINVLQATSSVSSSFASSSLSASVINILVTASNANYYIPFVTTNSFQPVYIDPNSIFYNPATDTLTVNIVSASFISASLFGTASWSTNSTTASYAISASYSVSSSVSISSSFASSFPKELATGSSYQITASMANTASFALNFNPSATASYAINAKSASYSVTSDTSSIATAIYNPFFVQVFS